MTWMTDQRERQGVEKVDGAVADFAARNADYVRDYANGNPEFGLWLALVDRRMGRAVGVTHRDIADWTWHDAFDDGVSPSEAAREALAADDTFGALFGDE